MELSPEQVRSLFVIFLTSCGAIGLVFLTATLSILLIFALKSAVHTILEFLALIIEIGIAAIAAVTSGFTVTLTIVLATSAAALSFPAASINSRMCLSMLVSSGSIVVSSLALSWFSKFRLNMEVAAAVVTTAAVSVALASAWAIGVLSLIEKETQQVGLKMTSILDAVRKNNHWVLGILVKLHFGLKAEDLNIALLHAVRAGYMESATVLLKAGANPNACDSYNNPPLTIACETGMYDMACLLIEYGAAVNVTNGSRATAMHSAAKWGYVRCVKLLLSQKATVNDQDSLWRTPLMLCVKHAKEPEPTMRLLIRAEASVNLIGCESRTVLHYAASRGRGVGMLIENGADPHIKDKDGNTGLHYAAGKGHSDIVTELLKVGCDPNSLNDQYRTPLHMTSIGTDNVCVEQLLSEGALPYIVDKLGNLPIYYASYYGNVNAVLSLIAVNSPLNSFEYNSVHYRPACPLGAALENRHFQIAKLLMIGGCKYKVFFDWLLHQPIEIQDRYANDLVMLKEFTYRPVSLLHGSRVVIRRMIGLSLNTSLRKIPLPTMLKEYILMKDLSYLRSEAKRLNKPVSSLLKIL